LNKRVLITGFGGVGTFAAHLLSRLPGIDIFVGDIREDYTRAKANAVFHSAYFTQDGPIRYPRVTPLMIDLTDIEGVKAHLAEIKPDVILHLATLMAAGRIRTSVAPDLVKRIYDGNPVGTGLRPWAPGHTVLLYNLMSAIRDIGLKTHVVNGSGCDFLNVAFDKIGLAPTCGLGDFVLAEPGIVKVVAERVGCAERDVQVFMVGHHSLIMPLYFDGTNHGIRYLLKIVVNGEDITDRFDIEKDIFPELPRFNSWPIEGASLADQEQTAGHAVQIVRAILFDTQEVLNVPGPQGLPGAYPCRVGADGVSVIVPAGTTLEEMIAINEAGNVAEGFKEIRDDGTMVATDLTVQIVEELFEIDWKYKEFKPHEGQAAFDEIMPAFERFVKKHNS